MLSLSGSLNFQTRKTQVQDQAVSSQNIQNKEAAKSQNPSSLKAKKRYRNFRQLQN